MLRKRYGDQLSSKAFVKMRRSLVDRHETLLRTVVEDDRKLPVVIESLREARLRAQDWKFTAEGFAYFARGLRRIYRQGRSEKKVAYAQPTTENFHSWRKRVKYLWYHTQILQPLSPKAMKVMERESDLLADRLGEEHDLAMLEASQHIGELPGVSGRNAELLIDLIARERGRRRSVAVPVADRMYVEKPAQFVNRIEGYWQRYQSKGLSGP